MKKLLILTSLMFLTLLLGCSIKTTESTTLLTTFTTTNTSTSTTESSFTETTTDLTTLTLTSDNTTTTQIISEPLQDIYLYSVNDFHGGAYLNFESFAKISDEIRYMKTNYDNVIALANGDIFQGTAISNYYYGRPIVEAMNAVDFDGFVIGNHEFDWGIEKILEYNDEIETNGEAEFSFLAANIVYKDTQEPLEFTQPYLLYETNGVKIGVIGVIGNVINSISVSRVENIQFLDPVTVIADYANYLRSEKQADIIVVYAHSGSYFNYDIANLTGNSRVDVVFNAHTHQSEIGTIEREGTDLIYAQASSNKYSLFVRIQLTYDLVNKVITFSQGKNYSDGEVYNYDSEVTNIFDTYKSNPIYLNFVNQVLTFSQGTYYRNDLAPWGASVIRDYLGIDIGAVNSGGFRTEMNYGELTMGELIVIYPFDNFIKTSRLTGQQVIDFYKDIYYNGGDVVFDDGVSFDGTTVYLNDIAINPTEYYTIGAVDYIFDKKEYDFIDGLDITNTGVLIRDFLVQDLLNSNNSFSPYNGTNYTEPLNYFYQEIFRLVI
ncbi:MAG: 5'-nucleotidase C-terminal domain-containing protein [Candidatus Izemoplasmatales bacterium]|nr:5'-nucleotidase C-terminal domain-containing protein [Candidatus Izemoplasmatales bacterium]